MSSGPFPGLIRCPARTVQLGGPGLSCFQPVRSFPLKSLIGLPHCGAWVLSSAGALLGPLPTAARGTPAYQLHTPPPFAHAPLQALEQGWEGWFYEPPGLISENL